MSPYWKCYYPGYLFALPHTVVGLLLALVYRAHSFRWSNGCLEAIGGTKANGDSRIFGQPSAQTHGWLIFYDRESSRDYEPMRVHERVHVVQGFIGGPLYVLAYVLCHAWGMLREWDFWQAYRENPFEKQAYARQWSLTAWGVK